MGDREKWNRKHEDKINSLKEPLPNGRLLKMAKYLDGKSALDLACGLGGNSFLIANKGYKVTSLDLSDAAVEYIRMQAEQLGLPVSAETADLTNLSDMELKQHSYDLVVMTYYLDRSIFSHVKTLIMDNGLFFMETYCNSERISRKYQLESNELLKEFSGWKILFFEEDELEGRQTILCRKHLD